MPVPIATVKKASSCSYKAITGDMGGWQCVLGVLCCPGNWIHAEITHKCSKLSQEDIAGGGGDLMACFPGTF